ncbi:response regulator [Paludibacterium yongneupense]|uniref:response regulator n=1 Tax=Paludibacterium yongneupense TaxID=400061 RepID=UPI000402921E|nr:response regulator [Paludibacterium yongneupense]
MNARIAIVEDEPELAELMADYARQAGFEVQCFADGRAAWLALADDVPDLLVLDLMLPGMDGLSLCRALRERSEVPIIMVTARGEETDRLTGLEIGADDYLCKPFSPRELIARIKVILRRSGNVRDGTGSLVFDDSRHLALCNNVALDLTPTEYRILQVLYRHPGHVYSRAQLLDTVKPEGLDVTDRAIDSHIKNLRRKLAPFPPCDEAIQSVYGVGYRWQSA